jgi:hypothetical protein
MWNQMKKVRNHNYAAENGYQIEIQIMNWDIFFSNSCIEFYYEL